MPEVVEAHAYQFMLCDFCGHTKVSILQLVRKLVKLSFSYCFFDNADPSLGVAELLEEFLLHHLPANEKFSGRPAYQVKAVPLSDCTKTAIVLHPLWLMDRL